MPRPELSTLRYPNLWQGCVGAWCPSQSGATGYRLFDDSGNNNHGVLSGMDPGTDWVPSQNKLAVDFDGVDDYALATIPTILMSQGSLTFNFWAVNPSGGNWLCALSNNSNINTWFGLNIGTNLVLFNRTDVGGDSTVSSSKIPGNYSAWRMITCISTTTSFSIYQNGILGAVNNRTIGTETTLNRIAIGALYRGALGPVGYTQSQFDDIRVYNRALTNSEIQQLYSGGRGAAYERSRGRKKAYVPGYRITAPSRIQTGSARTIDGTDTDSLSRGLVGAWCPSLGASGYRLLDRSGNNNHGTLTGMDTNTSWIPSGGKLALGFDGVNDYVDTGSNIGCNGANYRTISHWFKRSTNSTNHFLGCWGGSNTGGDRFGFYLLAQVLYVVAEGSGAGNAGYASWNANSNFYEWTHLLLQYDGSQPLFSTRLTLAVNGTFVPLLSPIGTVPTSLGTGLGNFVIGYNQSATQRYTTGQVDDVRLYRRPLTAQEVRLLYTGGRGVGLLPEAKPKRARIVAWDNQDKISVPARVLTNTDSLKRGLVGHWSPSVSGPQGNRLMDLSGQNNHGVLTNMDYQTDYVPSTDKGGRMALDFDGVDDRVVVPYKSEFLASNLRAIACWVNVRSFDGDFQVNEIISTDDVANASVRGWLVGVTDPNNNNLDGRFSITIFGTGGSYIDASISTEKLAVNKWYHLVASYDGGTSELGLSIFLDGEKQAVVSSMSGAFTAPNLPTNPLWIGRRPGIAIDTYYNGQLDDIRLYNRTLTPNEIRLLAQSRMPERATPQRTRTVFYSSGLVSYLRRRTYNSILGSGVLS